MKRILSLILITAVIAVAVPVFARVLGSDADQTGAKKTHRRHRHHRNHHKGHIQPDPYPSVQ